MQKKILLLIPNFGLGGAQRVFHDHSVELGKSHDVTESVFALDSENVYPSGKKVESLSVGGGGNTLNKALNFLRRITRLHHLKRRIKPDVCISYLEGADYVNILSRDTEKVILVIQGSKTYDNNIRGIMGWLRKQVFIPYLYKRADHIVAVSRDIIPEMVHDFHIPRRKLSVIENSFDVEQIQVQAQLALPLAMQAVYAAAPVLVTSGRLAEQKNQRPLLELFAALLREQPAKLIFVGDGELREELVSQALGLGLRVYEAWTNATLTPDYDVYFVGLQNNPFQYIKPASLFVFPSAWEGFPLALGEAMCCGIPVLSADCPTGPREMLAPTSNVPLIPIRDAEWADFGVLLPMLNSSITKIDDQKAWVNTINALLRDKEARQRLGKKAKERANDFTHASAINRWNLLLNKILNN